MYPGRNQRQPQIAWRKTLEVFDEERQRFTPLSLFPEGRPVAAGALDNEPGPTAICWLGCELWSQVLELLVLNRLIDPGSEFRVHRQWFDQSAMDVLLGQDFAVAEKDRLYRCPDRVRLGVGSAWRFFLGPIRRARNA